MVPVLFDLQNIVKLYILLSPFTPMEVVELLYVFEALTFLNRSGNPATGSRQHLEKIQCIFSSDFLLMGI